MSEPIVVDFPLRGEWVAPNTPGKRVPSHGTDWLGQRYAYDFIRTNSAADGLRFHAGSAVRHMTRGVRLKDCFGWGEPIHSPVDGVVVHSRDGWPERTTVHFIGDRLNYAATILKLVLKPSLRRASDLRFLAGNYLIIDAGDAYAFIAHAKTGSIKVLKNETVSRGQIVAEVGHSGNSSAPHLHFQLMDSPVLQASSGIPCCFREYEVYRAGCWIVIENGIPLVDRNT